jgi:hypothetical protein
VNTGEILDTGIEGFTFGDNSVGLRFVGDHEPVSFDELVTRLMDRGRRPNDCQEAGMFCKAWIVDRNVAERFHRSRGWLVPL